MKKSQARTKTKKYRKTFKVKKKSATIFAARKIDVNFFFGKVKPIKFWQSYQKQWPFSLKSLWRQKKRGRGRPRKKLPFLRWLILRLSQEIAASKIILKQNWQSLNANQARRVYKRKRHRQLKEQLHLAQSYRRHILLALLLTIFTFVSSEYVYITIFKDLPTTQDLLDYKPIVSTKILDRHGQLLYSIYQDENRTVVPLTDISPYLIWATIAIEDKNFYHHPGFDIMAIIRALLVNSSSDSVQGGSTITQQLVKNTVLSREKTLQRKIKELLISTSVDGSLSKDKILELYLNQVAYGGSTYGAEEAAVKYFGKSARDLDLAEAALLAGLPQAPSLYSPFGPYPERALMRQAEVLRRMVEDGYITNEQAQAAKAESINFAQNGVVINAPHFVMYVKQLLAQEFGEDMVNQGGLIVTTTLDLNLQTQAETIVKTELDQLARLKISNGAALITVPKTGEVLSMVGSKNYFDFAHDGQVNVTLRPRQPGSSIKPVTYALALSSGKTPASILQDTPITFLSPGSQPYSPVNYDGKFHGPVPLRIALASSYNVPAVKTLAEFGINKMIDLAENMGITTWENRDRFGLSLTLGGGEVRMIDMNEVYGTFANLGYSVPINPILEVKTYDGQVLYRNNCALDQNDCRSKKTLDPMVAAQITNILADNSARAPAFGTQSVLTIPGQQVAVKTGTTNSMRDNWTIGYTNDQVAAVWVGNNDNSPMSYVASGITGASPIWNKLIRLSLNKNQPHVFSRPEDMVEVTICATTGTLPCEGCPQLKKELFIPGTQPTARCKIEDFQPAENSDQNQDKNQQGQILKAWTSVKPTN